MRAHATGAVFARTVVMPPWGLRLGGSIQLAVHAVTRGKASLCLDDPADAVELRPGEISLVRGGSAHHIAHEPGACCLEPDEFRAQYRRVADDADRGATVVLCGAYRFSGDVASGLAGRPSARADALVRGRRTAPRSHRAGVPRAHQRGARPADRARPPARRAARPGPPQRLPPQRDRTPLVPGVRRPTPARCAAGHARDAGHSWTVPELAAISGLSRAAFARVFRDALGQAPLQYLTEWRMTLARDHLRAGELSLANIAATVGYGSPYAFAAAFRRHHGIAPGAWRQQQSTAPLTLSGAEDPAAGRVTCSSGLWSAMPTAGRS